MDNMTTWITDKVVELEKMTGFEMKLPEVNKLATTAVVGGVLIGASYLIKTSIRYSGAPPGPRRIPFLGNIEFTPDDGAKFNDALQELCKKYGPILCMYIGNKPVVVISDYTILREAFVTKGIDMAGRPDSDLILSYNPDYPHPKGIIDENYSDEWKKQRHTAVTILKNLGLGRSIIEKTIQVESEAVMEQLAGKGGAAFNPASVIGTAVPNIICSLLFGERNQYGDPAFLDLIQAIDDLLLAFANDPGGAYIPFMKLTPGYGQVWKDAMKAGEKLIAFYRKNIQKAKDRLASGEEPNDFVMCYLNELECSDSAAIDTKIKEDWTIQHVSDFFLAGAETTSTTLQWAMLYMANNQDVQEKVFNEISSKLKKDHLICLKDRETLPYTDATIMEIQRISGLAPIGVPHEALVDSTIAGYKIPKGTEIWGNIYGVLRDPKTFPEPHKLKPERFLNETLDSVTRHDHWIPFSLGRRTCVGEQLARQELFLFFTNIIRSFKVLPPEGVNQIKFSEVFKFVLKPTEYQVRFIKR